MAGTEAKPKVAAPAAPKKDEARAPKDDALAEGGGALAVLTPPSSPAEMALRVVLGVLGLVMLVGFFLPWLSVAGPIEGAPLVAQSGLTLATSGDLVGTPAPLLFLVPALGAVLSAASFMGFRFAPQVAVGIALTLLGYALYVLLQMFVHHTELGLWLVSGGTFLVLLLGMLAWNVTRRPREGAPEPEPEPAKK